MFAFSRPPGREKLRRWRLATLLVLTVGARAQIPGKYFSILARKANRGPRFRNRDLHLKLFSLDAQARSCSFGQFWRVFDGGCGQELVVL